MRKPRYNDDFDYEGIPDDVLNPQRRGRRKDVVSLEGMFEDEDYREYGLIYDMRNDGDGILGLSEHDASETTEYLEDKGISRKIDLRRRRDHQDFIDNYKAFKKRN